MHTMHSIIHVTLVCLLLVGSSRADIYSSFVHLQEAVRTVLDSNETSVLKQYIVEQRAHLALYKNVLKLQEELKGIVRSEDYGLDNPIVAVKFAGWTSIYISSLLDVINTKGPVLDRTVFANRNNQPFVPTTYDLDESITGLIRLQDMHRLITEDMASGNVAGFQTIPLTTLECLEIAKRAQLVYKGLDAFNANPFRTGMAVSWLNATEARVSSEEEAKLLIEASTAVYTRVQCQCSSDNLERMWRMTTMYPSLKVTTPLDCQSQNLVKCRSFPLQAEKDITLRNFDALCRGETVNPTRDLEYQPTPKHQLRCRYIHNNDPTLLLKPVKMEELNLVPPTIAILHDVIDKTEIENLKRTAKPRLRRGTVRRIDGQHVSLTKVSKQYYIPQNISEGIIPHFRRRLSAATGLHLRSFKKIQVVNYGTGGFYNIHLDMYTPNVLDTFNDTTNNQLATMVTYLENVHAGGETTFPLLGISVKPKKGSALLFFNLKRNGGLVYDSVHSSCPIIYGEKWIANQWVNRDGQEFNFRCLKDKTK